MAIFDDYGFVLYALGEKGHRLTDEEVDKGFKLIASRLVADAIIKSKGQDIGSALDYFKKAYPTLQKWVKEDYNVLDLDSNLDFVNNNAEEYFNNPDHKNFTNELETLTSNPAVIINTVYPDMVDFYYKSGACLRNDDNKNVADLRNLIGSIETLEGVSEEQKQFIRNKVERLSSIYPTKEQMREAYRDFLSGRQTSGLSVAVFKDPKVNGHADERYLTKAERRDIAKTIDSATIKRQAQYNYVHAFNAQPVSEEEDAAMRSRPDGDDYWDIHDAYYRFRGRMHERGNMPDQESVAKALTALTALKDLHDNRPWYQLLFGAFGEVGRENRMIERMVNDLIRRNIADRNTLNRVLAGDEEARKQIINEQATKEQRERWQSGNDTISFLNSLNLEGPQDPRLVVQELEDDNGVTHYRAFLRINARQALEIFEDDVKNFLGGYQNIINAQERAQVIERNATLEAARRIHIDNEEIERVSVSEVEENELIDDIAVIEDEMIDNRIRDEQIGEMDLEFEQENKDDVVPFEAEIDAIEKDDLELKQ